MPTRRRGARNLPSSLSREAPFRRRRYRRPPFAPPRTAPARTPEPPRGRVRGRGHGGNGAVDVLDQESGGPVGDQLRHRAAVERDDGRPARHRLDDAVAEGLVEVDQVQQRVRAAEQTDRVGRADGTDVTTPCRRRSAGATSSSKYRWSCTIPAITSGMPARRATSIASAVPLSGWMRPKNSRYRPGSACSVNASVSMP